MANGNGHKIYWFDEFSLDAEKLMLYRGEREITLPPKVVKTLAVLVENKGEILSKDELIEAVWSDSIVEESNLSQYLYLLRKTLGNKPDGRPYIETLRRRGYRFNGPVETIPEPASKIDSKKESFGSSEFEVRKEGNVLRLVERSIASPETDPIEVAQLASVQSDETSKPHTRRWMIVVGAALFLIIGSMAVGYRYWIANEAESDRKEISITRLTNTDYVHFATISRDGNYIAYDEPLDETSRIWLQQTGGPNKVEIVSAGKWISWFKTFSPDGKYLYFVVTEGKDRDSLFRILTLGGTPEKVLSNVHSAVSFSPDGKEILFVRRNQDFGRSSLMIAPSDGKGAEREIVAGNEEFAPTSAAWSPDGSMIAFGAIRTEATILKGFSLYVFDTTTGAVKPLSDEVWDNCYRLEWLPDGSAIAMIGTRRGEGLTSGRDQVYLITYPDGRSTRLTSDGSRHEPESLGVTNDGSIVAVSFNRASQIWSIDAGGDSQTVVQLTTGFGEGRGGMATLPDGRVGYLAKVYGGISLMIMAADGSNLKQLVPPSQIEQLAATPDGKRFVYRNTSIENSHLFSIGTDGGDPQQLTFGDSADVYASVSPDGKWILYESTIFRGGRFVTSIKRIPVSGGEPITLVDDGCWGSEYSPDGLRFACYGDKNLITIRSSDDGSPLAAFEAVKASTGESRWTPDGQALVYIVHQNNVCNLWKQPIDGGKPEPLTDFTRGQCYNFVYSRDGSRIYLARGYEMRDAILIKNYK